MISKEFIKTQLKKLNEQFNFIFSNNDISSSISSDQTLQSILKECLSIHSFLETSNKVTKKNNKLFVEKYEQFSKEKFMPSKVKYEKESDILDQLNWMKVYCENTYNVDILSHSVSAAPVTQIVENSTKKLEEQKVVSAGVGADMDPNRFIELSQKMQRVNERLNNDIATGKLYIFKSKPKHIVLVKKIYAYLLACLSFSIFMMSIFMFILENTKTASGGSWISWTDGLIGIFICGICTMMTIQTFMSLYNKKLINNDNVKYQFKWQISILIYVILLFYILSTCITGFNPISTIFSTIFSNVNFNNTQKIEAYIFVGSISAMCLFYILSLIPFIIAAALNPKRDDKVIESKMAEYLKDPTI